MDADAWNERYSTSELVWTAEPNRYVVQECESLPVGRALDLACGEGRNAVWLAGLGWRVVGVDFASAGLEKGRQLAAARDVDVEWVLADVTRYEPEPGAFDLVVVAYLHLPRAQLLDVLARAQRALAPGGTLVVVGHDITNPVDGYGGPQDTAVLYGPDDVAGALDQLVVERAERVRRPVSTDTGTVHAIDVLVRARRPA
jgi:SAM-dependent methyltransferase